MDEKFDISEAIKRMKNGAKIANKDLKFAEYFCMKNKKLSIKFYNNPDLSDFNLLNRSNFIDKLLNSEEFYEVL